MCVTPLAAAFRSSFAYSSGWHRKGSRRSLTKRYNWFKDVVSEAFANNESFDDAYGNLDEEELSRERVKKASTSLVHQMEREMKKRERMSRNLS